MRSETKAQDSVSRGRIITETMDYTKNVFVRLKERQRASEVIDQHAGIARNNIEHLRVMIVRFRVHAETVSLRCSLSF